MPNNFKLFSRAFFALFIAFLFLLPSGVLRAQPVFEKNLTLGLQQMGFGLYDDKLVYEFFLDAAEVNNLEFNKISEITITSDRGPIKFPIEILKGEVPRYFMGELSPPNFIEDIIITKATAKFDGVLYDITGNITPRESFQVPVRKEIEGPGACPDIRLDINLKEGEFVRFNKDSSEAFIKIEGAEKGFPFSASLSYFFNNDANKGKKIKFVATTIQGIDPGSSSRECVPVDRITDVFAAN
jgi:hypothetical protein